MRLPEPVIVVEAVRPLKAVEEVAKVMVAPVWVWPGGPREVMPLPTPPLEMQLPLREKQPDESSMPPANVEVAEPFTESAAVPTLDTFEMVPPSNVLLRIVSPEKSLIRLTG
jgi:hypothetical protein